VSNLNLFFRIVFCRGQFYFAVTVVGHRRKQLQGRLLDVFELILKLCKLVRNRVVHFYDNFFFVTVTGHNVIAQLRTK